MIDVNFFHYVVYFLELFSYAWLCGVDLQKPTPISEKVDSYCCLQGVCYQWTRIQYTRYLGWILGFSSGCAMNSKKKKNGQPATGMEGGILSDEMSIQVYYFSAISKYPRSLSPTGNPTGFSSIMSTLRIECDSVRCTAPGSRSGLRLKFNLCHLSL